MMRAPWVVALLGGLWRGGAALSASWDVLRRRPDSAEYPAPDVELVVCDETAQGRREIGWLEAYKSDEDRADLLHARLVGEEDRVRLFGTNLLVDARARRRGVATALLRALERLATEWDISETILSATPAHEASWALYRKLGYEKVPSTLGPKSGSVLLRKKVPTRTSTS